MFLSWLADSKSCYYNEFDILLPTVQFWDEITRIQIRPFYSNPPYLIHNCWACPAITESDYEDY